MRSRVCQNGVMGSACREGRHPYPCAEARGACIYCSRGVDEHDEHGHCKGPREDAPARSSAVAEERGS